MNKVKVIVADIKRYFQERDWEALLRIVILGFLTLAVFSTFAFSSRVFFNNINNLIYFILLALIGLYLIIYKRFVLDKFFVALALFNFIIIASAVFNGKFTSQVITMMLLSATTFTVYQFLILDRRNREHFVSSLVIAGIGFIFYFILAYFREFFTFDFSNRLGDKFDNVNGVAQNLSIIVVTLLYLAMFHNKQYLYIFVALGLYSSFLTGSMWTNLVLLMTVVVLLHFKIPKGKRYIIWLVLLGLAVLFIGLIHLPRFDYFKRRVYGFVNTLFGIETGSIDQSSSVRIELIKEGFLTFLRKPLLGFGPDQFRYYSSFGLYAHSNIIELMANYGGLGLLAFEFFLIFPLVNTWKTKAETGGMLVFILIINRTILQFNTVIYSSKILFFIFAFAFSSIYSISDKSLIMEVKFNKQTQSEEFELPENIISQKKNIQ